MTSRVLVLLVSVPVLFGGGFFAGSLGLIDFFPSRTSLSLERRSGEEGSLINPLLDCTEPEASFEELRPFSVAVKDLVDKSVEDRKITDASVYFRDLNNGPWFGVNEQLTFSPASLLKVPLAVSYYQYKEYEADIMDERLTWRQDSQQRINDLAELEEGKEYSVSELIQIMLVHSDNAATELLVDRLPLDQLLKPYQDLDLEPPKADGGQYQISIRNYAKLLRVLFNASYLDRPASREILSMLSRSGFTMGLRAGVPESIIVANKYGERVSRDLSELHDCGIVYYPSHPYLLCMMTHGKDIQAMTGVIRDISALVYREVDAQFGR
jgi:beta-lactamase class A